MQLENLNKFSDQELLTHFSLVVQRERETITTVVSCLSEIDERKLYLKEAFPSLFSFVTQKFCYSEGAAYRRIQAARVSRLFPEVLELLSQGKTSLMTLSLIEPHLTRENGKELIKQVMGKSKREVESILSELSFKKINYKDVIRRLPVVSMKKESGIGRHAEGSGCHAEPEATRGEGRSISHGDSSHCVLGMTSKELEMTALKVEEGGKALDTFRGVSAFPPPPASPSSSEPKTAQNFTFTSESSDVATGENCRPSTAKVENELVRKTGDVPKQEVRRIKIEFVAEEGMAEKIERAKEILRHKFPEGKFEDIFNQALEDMLEKRDPMRRSKRVSKRNARAVKVEKNHSEPQSPACRNDEKSSIPVKKSCTRYIPERLRLEIWRRDGGKCSYESSSGKKCKEKAFLEIDHVEPWALGGKSTEENLRLLCSAHNRWRTQQTFKYRNT